MAATQLSTALHPLFTEYVLKKLHKHRVSTVYSFVKIDSVQLEKISNLPAESILQIKSALVERFSGSCLVAASCIDTEEVLLSTGIAALDTLLQGGMLPGHIYELCGLSGSGKTHLCLTLAANVAIRNSTVYFIDTKCDFSATKVQQILEKRHIDVTERLLGHTMARIMVERILSPGLLVQTVEELADGKHVEGKEWPKLLIIDSLPSLWYLFQDAKSSCQPLGLLTKLLCSLRKLAILRSVTVVVVNLSVKADSTMSGKRRSNVGYHPALGRYWESAPGTRLQLLAVDEGDKRMIQVSKSNYMRLGDRTVLRIGEAGVS